MKMQTVKPASKTKRSPSRLRLSGGAIPLAGRRRVETLRGLAFQGRCFVVGPTGSAAFAVPRSARSLLVKFESSRLHHKASSYVRARIDTAHGPEWAAPRKHPRQDRQTNIIGRLQGAYGSGRPAESVNDSSKVEVRAVGTYRVHNQHLKSSGFDRVMLGSGSVFINRGGSTNPCIRRPMDQQKEDKGMMNSTPIADAILEMVKAEHRLKTSHSSGERAFLEMREARSAKEMVERLISEALSEVKSDRN